MEKKNPDKLVYKVSLIISAVVLIAILYLSIFSEDAVNSRHHVPESGWGVLIGTFLLTPVFIIFAVITFFTRAAYKRKEKELNQSVAPPLAEAPKIEPPVPPSQ